MASKDTQPAMTYPTVEVYEQWKDEADKKDMSVSEWIQAMVEAGRKKFSASVTPDQSEQELREQRNDLKRQLADARSRIEDLEDQLHRGERAEVIDFVRNNPGSTYEEVVQNVQDTAPARIDQQLESLEGEKIHYDNEGYYADEGVELV